MFGENDGDLNNIKQKVFMLWLTRKFCLKSCLIKINGYKFQFTKKEKEKDDHLLHGVEDVVVDVLLCVNGKGVI